MHTVTLPWPPSALSPNKRGHWAKAAKPKAAYRALCARECMAQGMHRLDADEVQVFIQFHPPDRRRRDDDNIIASFKAGRDGVADCIGVDDHKWQCSYRVHKEPVKGGCVKLTIVPLKVLEMRGQIS